MKKRGKRGHVARRAKSAMKQLQNTEEIIFSKKAHATLCREILQNQYTAVRFSKQAQLVLAESSQELISQLFIDSREAAEFAGRVTVMLKDVQYVRRQWEKQDQRVSAAL